MSDRPVEKAPQEIDQDNLPLMILEEALSWTATTFEQRMDMRTRFADALYAERTERDKRLEDAQSNLEASERALSMSRNQTLDAFERVAKEHNEKVALERERDKLRDVLKWLDNRLTKLLYASRACLFD